ncbi:hypothetical protein Adt_42411 [Abeliophyllum distichum]|uniref:Uncharacterized protein n=1 Tax=Abeliophyllum distichum TaxID=126358 RepID=A0ABD1PRN8_9LAMI
MEVCKFNLPPLHRHLATLSNLPVPNLFKLLNKPKNNLSDKFKGVDFTPNIPKTHYSEEEDDSTYRGSESPTLSDMRSQRDQLNVISSTIDRKREFKKDKDPQVRSFRKNLKRLLSKERNE